MGFFCYFNSHFLNINDCLLNHNVTISESTAATTTFSITMRKALITSSNPMEESTIFSTISESTNPGVQNTTEFLTTVQETSIRGMFAV